MRIFNVKALALLCGFLMISSMLLAYGEPASAIDAKLQCYIQETNGRGTTIERTIEKYFVNGRAHFSEASQVTKTIEFYVVSEINDLISVKIYDREDGRSPVSSSTFAQLSKGDRSAKMVFTKDRDETPRPGVEIYTIWCEQAQ